MSYRVGIVTPWAGEQAIEQASDSIANQVLPDGGEVEIHHIVVDDGSGESFNNKATVAGTTHLIRLGNTFNDVGASPRGIGSSFAVALGCQCVMFLDADNTYEPQHVATMLAVHFQSKSRVVGARRRILHWQDDVEMGVKDFSDGDGLVDTNCLVLFDEAVLLAPRWVEACKWKTGKWQPQQPNHTGADRYFWRDIVRPNSTANGSIPFSGQKTVNYRTRWFLHYVDQTRRRDGLFVVDGLRPPCPAIAMEGDQRKSLRWMVVDGGRGPEYAVWEVGGDEPVITPGVVVMEVGGEAGGC